MVLRSVLWFFIPFSVSALLPCSNSHITRRIPALGRGDAIGLQKGEPETKEEETQNPVAKVSWFAVEAFGKAFGAPKESSQQLQIDRSPTSLDETLERLKLDNERSYFLSGEVDGLIYDEQCTFADPFVSFQGRDRFVDNLSNLGSFITSYSARELEYTVLRDDYTVETKFMVKLQLNLPWKPILAWPWGVKCVINPTTNLIELHEESVSLVCYTAFLLAQTHHRKSILCC